MDKSLTLMVVTVTLKERPRVFSNNQNEEQVQHAILN